MMYIDQKYLKEPCCTKEELPTVWGTAKLTDTGYWRITRPVEEEYDLKYVHRLVYETEHKLTLLPGVVVHHIDENPLNNHITNLQMMSQKEHSILHNKGKPTLEETKKKIRESCGGGFPHKINYGTKNGKQRYAVVDENGNKIKQSIYEDVVNLTFFEVLVPYKRKFGYL